MFTVVALSLVGCSSNGDSASNSSYDNSYTTNDDSDSDSSSSSSSSSSVEHTVMLVDVQKEEQKVVTGLSGDLEYYCQEHYDEMQKYK